MDIKKIITNINNSLLNDDFRQSFILVTTSALLSIICMISCIPHFIDDPSPKIMAIILIITAACSLSIFFLTIFLRKYHSLYRYIFMTIIVIFCGYLIYDGGPDGFLHFWILLIPAFSFISFGLMEGFICSIPLFIIMILFYWTPLGEYAKYPVEANVSADFRLRMTFVYSISLLLGFAAELFRYVAARNLKSTNDHLEFISTHDPLTNVANQHYLQRYLKNIYENKKENETFACLFVDVDNFKNVNDKYSHLFGNAVLVKIAEILLEEKKAFVCRWGGDEFVVCFKDIDEDLLIRIGEKYRASVSAYRFEDKPKFHITISVGAVVMPIDDDFNFDHVLELADSANRKAKMKGKDTVLLLNDIENNI